ncbi:ATP synthase F1 subunit gamma [Candidatus Parcubacteria bacterium]|nr:ATP synthase F1 subunit gamma [Patescibacteria group bacterium]MCG2694047.1 ATP synthase F1 subunit gamma [Candidatus Parcubacteria bacterium]
MPTSTKTIKTRIASVKNTRKITKAMEMVSAAKMRRATDSVLSTRPYSNLAWQIIGNIKNSKTEIQHPLLIDPSSHKATKGKHTQEKLMVILITSDKGLCGSLNSQMFREIKHFLTIGHPTSDPSSVITRNEATRQSHENIDFIIIGKKGEAFAKREKLSVTAGFEDLTNKPKFTDVKPIAKIAIDRFIDNTYSKVYVAYTDYISVLIQKARVRQLLPIIRDEELGNVENNNQSAISNQQSAIDYLFEPQKDELLEMLLPKIVETQIYQAILESVASEQSARMVAMKNATDAANEMVDDLTLTFNKLRQAGITREISEISAGKAALE